ncbi:glucose-inducible SAM-dependent methyltransferase Rrg1, putative [Talaromyces stipitatus ATCC 10500]|uniref:Glucose-inducible SAM-dependent methyltransferase Rrg1, putative n=1 Tax=Talaromyces stipitatus (strain ATCC 10500 / CBS 375.48 / QM 6759 / NRRL 1006) TaxID=441959 RepID=B8M0N7_TALSN|nr:glucose-inducible SAM-dependent methyltransferase Rrg1, putative [Talaromyces stipitatus ATCC 10500]EED21420.1 glucose-inducible SAM-dependent methyltransferase Rrg1, putative [Talaromyces stipitatus ATCC 10500]
MITADEDEPLHVLDLPQLYTKPTAIEILKALDHLAIQPKSFGFGARDVARRKINSSGVTEYLTTIVSSSLAWLDSDDLREQIWDVAAARLSERAGRTAMPALTRLFHIPTSSGEELALTLHEPSLTSDNLGMKTWLSSYLLSRRLDSIFESVPELVRSESSTSSTSTRLRALELGSGTGLVGLSFAALREASASIHLTDLPAIVPNLTQNVELNFDLLQKTNAEVTTGILDWSIHPTPNPTKDELYDVILAADPLYSPDHPKWLVQTINTWISKGLDARVVVELPLRDAYAPQVDEFRQRMQDIGLAIVEQGNETGYDDWEDADGQSMEVHCWWSVWGWSEKF